MLTLSFSFTVFIVANSSLSILRNSQFSSDVANHGDLQYEENIRLNRIENLQNDINQIQTTIESLNRELEQLNSDTTEMLFRQNESALVRHHQLLKQSIEHINHVLRRRSNSNESLFDQLKVDLTSQQEKLFLIRNQLLIRSKNMPCIDIINICNDNFFCCC